MVRVLVLWRVSVTDFDKMKFIVVSLLFLLTSGCSIVDVVDHHQKNNVVNAGFERHQIELNEGGELHYWQGGNPSAPAILLLHGFGGTGITSWYEIMRDLVLDYHVIVPDLLWFGDSFSHAPATIKTETEAIQQLIDFLALQKVNVVGISFGGFVTFDLMVHEPKVDKVVMLASPGVFFSDVDLQAMTQRFGAEKPQDVFVPKNGVQVRLLLENTFVDYPWMPSFIDEDVYEYYFADFLAEKESLITTLPAYRDVLASEIIFDSLPPTLLIWGENDNVFPIQNGQYFADYLNAPIIIIPNGAHGLSNDFPQQITQEIRSFIQ